MSPCSRLGLRSRLRIVLMLARQCSGHGSERNACAACNRDVGRRAPVSGGQCVVETALVPEIRLRATDAPVTGLDRETGPVVPFHRGAGVVGGRALAPELFQPPSLLAAFVVETFANWPRS